MKNFLLKAFQLAIIADQEYQNAQTNGAKTLLQPGNVEGLVTELATVLGSPAQS